MAKDATYTPEQAAQEIRRVIMTEQLTGAEVVARRPELAVGLEEYLATQPPRAQGSPTRVVRPEAQTQLLGRSRATSLVAERLDERSGENLNF